RRRSARLAEPRGRVRAHLPRPRIPDGGHHRPGGGGRESHGRLTLTFVSSPRAAKVMPHRARVDSPPRGKNGFPHPPGSFAHFQTSAGAMTRPEGICVVMTSGATPT